MASVGKGRQQCPIEQKVGMQPSEVIGEFQLIDIRSKLLGVAKINYIYDFTVALAKNDRN